MHFNGRRHDHPVVTATFRINQTLFSHRPSLRCHINNHNVPRRIPNNRRAPDSLSPAERLKSVAASRCSETSPKGHPAALHRITPPLHVSGRYVRVLQIHLAMSARFFPCFSDKATIVSRRPSPLFARGNSSRYLRGAISSRNSGVTLYYCLSTVGDEWE